MHNALNYIVAQRHKRPKEQHVKIDVRIVDEMLASTDKLIQELNSVKAENNILKERLATKK